MAAPIYLDNRSVLVSTSKGLKRIHVPFVVVVVSSVDDLMEGERMTVILVGFSKRDSLLYLIRNRYYLYSYFVIVLDKAPP